MRLLTALDRLLRDSAQAEARAIQAEVVSRKEYDRMQRERMKRHEHELKRLAAEEKRAEARQAAEREVEFLDEHIKRLWSLSMRIDEELNNPNLTEYKRIQLEKQSIAMEEKIYKAQQKRDKAYFTAHSQY